MILSWILALFAPTHPIAIVLLFPAAAVRVHHRWGAPALGWVTAAGILGVMIFAALVSRSDSRLIGILFFTLTLGLPLAATAASVAVLAGPRRPGLLTYLVAVGAAILTWMVGLFAAIAIARPVGGIA